jgi:hypothetical protein
MKVISKTMGNSTFHQKVKRLFNGFPRKSQVRRRRISSKMKFARTAKELPCVKPDSHYYWMWMNVEYDVI